MPRVLVNSILLKDDSNKGTSSVINQTQLSYIITCRGCSQGIYPAVTIQSVLLLQNRRSILEWYTGRNRSMRYQDVVKQRVSNQCLAGNPFKRVEGVVAWLGAVQAQDYLGSLWALGLRMHRAVEADVEQAIADRTIVRSWPLRGTLHYAAADDIRWMLDLVAPRTISRAARRYRQLDLDDATLAKSETVLVRALESDGQCTRAELASALNRAGITTDGQRLIHILNHAALNGLFCYATRRGKQFTFALLNEWVPAGTTLTRDEALAELARRYFTGHGPATLQDFVWWSGLLTADARAGLNMVKSQLRRDDINGQTYWYSRAVPIAQDMPSTAHLLPAFDEYLVGYRDRSAVIDPKYTSRLSSLLSPTVVIDGQVAGTWKRTVRKDAVVITVSPFVPLSDAQTDALAAAAEQYGRFVELTVILS